jgi:hypothetical protein
MSIIEYYLFHLGVRRGREMPKRDVWEEIYIQFLVQVYKRIKKIRHRVGSKRLTETELEQYREFQRIHSYKTFQEFLGELKRTGILQVDYNPETKKTHYRLFGFTRTLFIGILKGDPRTGYTSGRIEKYKATFHQMKTLEDVLIMYRKYFGFRRINLTRKQLRQAGVLSHCSGKSEDKCDPKRCEWIETTPFVPGYCRTKLAKPNFLKTRKQTRK